MTDLEFLVYAIIITVIILLIIWLFFGGGTYKYVGLDILDPPRGSVESETCDIESNSGSTESEVCDIIEEIEEKEVVDLGMPKSTETAGTPAFSKRVKEEPKVCDVTEEIVDLTEKAGTPAFSKREKEGMIKSTEEMNCSIMIPTVIKKLPTYDIEYYRNFKFSSDKIKHMESRTALESRGESLCRSILEKYFNKPFPSSRPDFLNNPETGKNLEIDCFNEELSLGLEYNGGQHYDWPNKFHKTYEEFEAQRRRDQLKREICNKSGIYLITVPYRIPHHRLPEYIEYYLPENVQHRRDNEIEDTDDDDFVKNTINNFPKNGYI